MSGCPADPRPAPGSVRFLWISHQCVVFRASWGSCHARLSLPAGSRGAPVGVPAGRSERLPGGAHPTLQAALALPLTSARCPSARACQAELSARVRRDESLREAPLSPGLPAAGKKGGVLAVGREDEGGPPPRPGFTTDLGVLVMWMPPPAPSHCTPMSSRSLPEGRSCQHRRRRHSPAGWPLHTQPWGWAPTGRQHFASQVGREHADTLRGHVALEGQSCHSGSGRPEPMPAPLSAPQTAKAGRPPCRP